MKAIRHYSELFKMLIAFWFYMEGIGAIILLFSSVLILCGTKSGVPFGRMYFTEKSEPKVFDSMPMWLPFWWVAIMVLGRETARLILHPYRRQLRYGYWMIGVAAWTPSRFSIRRTKSS